MTGSDADWEKMTNKEMHDKFATLVMANTKDVDKRLGEALDKLVDFEKSFDAKLDTKFNELLARSTTTNCATASSRVCGACTTCST